MSLLFDACCRERRRAVPWCCQKRSRLKGRLSRVLWPLHSVVRWSALLIGAAAGGVGVSLLGRVAAVRTETFADVTQLVQKSTEFVYKRAVRHYYLVPHQKRARTKRLVSVDAQCVPLSGCCSCKRLSWSLRLVLGFGSCFAVRECDLIAVHVASWTCVRDLNGMKVRRNSSKIFNNIRKRMQIIDNSLAQSPSLNSHTGGAKQ